MFLNPSPPSLDRLSPASSLIWGDPTSLPASSPRCFLLGPYRRADQERSLGVRMNNFPPPPSPILSCHGWISGVVSTGTLAQTGQPYGASLAFGAAVRLGLPSHTPSRERPLLSKASFALVQLPPAHGCL